MLVMRIKKTNLAVLLITVFAFLVRIAFVNDVPPSLNWDEVSHGINARFVLQSGRDEWMNQFPGIFRAYGDYKLPVYIYTLSIFFRIFGESDLVVRLPSILAGTFLVPLFFLVSRKIVMILKINTNADLIGILGSLLLAINPWNFFTSRIALEANLALFIFVLGGAILLYSKSYKWIISGLIILSLSALTYNSFRVLTPIVILVLPLLNLTSKLKKPNLRIKLSNATLLGWVISLLISVSSYLMPGSLSRFENVSLINQATVGEIEQLRNSSDMNPIIERIIYNRPVYFVSKFVKNYVVSFSPAFLFLEGGSQRQFSLPGFGVMYLVSAPLLIMGGLIFFRAKSNKFKLFLVLLLLASPIAASSTNDAPHVLRLIPLSVALVFLSAVGFGFIYQKNRVVFTAILLLLLLNSAIYLRNYFTVYADKYSASWQFGSKEMVEIVRSKEDAYQKVLITKKYGEPHAFMVWYSRYSYNQYVLDDNLVRYQQSNWWWVDAFDKYIFLNDWQISDSGPIFSSESGVTVDCSKVRCLLVTSPNNAPSNWSKLESIYGLEGEVVYEFYEQDI